MCWTLASTSLCSAMCESRLPQAMYTAHIIHLYFKASNNGVYIQLCFGDFALTYYHEVYRTEMHKDVMMMFSI